MEDLKEAVFNDRAMGFEWLGADYKENILLDLTDATPRGRLLSGAPDSCEASGKRREATRNPEPE
jgi:hypothetical protein